MKTDYEYLTHLLYEYFYRQQIYRENDLVQLTNNISFRHADALSMSGCSVPSSYLAIFGCEIPVSFATSRCVNPVLFLAFFILLGNTFSYIFSNLLSDTIITSYTNF